MKKRLLSFLTVMTLIIGILPGTALAAGNDETTKSAYSEIVAEKYYSLSGVSWDGTNKNIGGGQPGRYVLFKNVDFTYYDGTTPDYTKNARNITIYYGNYRLNTSTGEIGEGDDFEIYVASPGDSLASATYVGKIKTGHTGSWNTRGSISGALDIAGGVGSETDPDNNIKDVYIKWKSDRTGNLFGFKFGWEHTTVTGPETKLYKDNGDPASNALQWKKSGAVASVERNEPTDGSQVAKLLLAEYNAKGTMVSLRTSEEKTIANGITNFEILPETKATSANFLGAYFWNADNSVFSNSKLSKAFTNPIGTSSTSNIDVDILGSKVTISGSGYTNSNGKALSGERAIVMVIKGDYDGSTKLYDLTSNVVQVWETDITDGKYFYSFDMIDNTGIDDSGKYTAIVGSKTIGNPVKYSFNFVDPEQTYNKLRELRDAGSASAAISILKRDASMYGLEAELFSGIDGKNDETLVYNAVNSTFTTHPLATRTDKDYTAWVEWIKDAVLPHAVTSHIKNASNPAKSGEYISEYADKLGLTSADFNAAFKTPVGSTSTVAEQYEKNRKALAELLDAALLDTDDYTALPSAIDNDITVAALMNAAQSWGFVDKVFTDYYSLFNSTAKAQIDAYKDLKNEYKSELLDKFKSEVFNNIAEIESFLDANIADYDKEEYKEGSQYELEPSKVGAIELTIDLLQDTTPKVEEGKISFTDLGSVSWAEASINYMASMGYVNGKGVGIFAPNDRITREEFAAILVRTFGFNTNIPADVKYNDVDSDAWYAPYIYAATRMGIVNGLENNNFGVGQYITREQIATMLKRTVDVIPQKLLPFKGTMSFADFAYISDWAYSSVMYLARAQIINGTGNGNFSPKQFATRAEAAVMIHRLLQNLI